MTLQSTTSAALAALTDSPDFKRWMSTRHAGLRVEDDHEVRHSEEIVVFRLPQHTV